MNYNEIVVLTHLVISLLSFVILILLITKFIGDSGKDYNIHRLTKVLAMLAFFLCIDSLFFCISYFGSLGISPKLAYLFSDSGFQFFSTLGIFISLILLTHFIFDKRIELIKHSEDELTLMQELNLQLERKAKSLENEKESQLKKITDLEKFNQIAKERESKMIGLTKKIEGLNENLGRKVK